MRKIVTCYFSKWIKFLNLNVYSGDNECGKTTLIAKLQGVEEPKKGIGLEYYYLNVKDEYRDGKISDLFLCFLCRYLFCRSIKKISWNFIIWISHQKLLTHIFCLNYLSLWQCCKVIELYILNTAEHKIYHAHKC